MPSTPRTGRRPPRLLAACLVATTLSWVAPAAAQPDPSFRSDCAGLRAALARLPSDGPALVSVQVVGRLRQVKPAEAVAYLALCGAPDPAVVCVAYQANGAQAGDEVVVSGTYDPDSTAERVLLDPCLQFRPGDGTAPPAGR